MNKEIDMWMKYIDELTKGFRGVEATAVDGSAVESGVALRRCVDMILRLAAEGGKIVYIGNGGSAGIASHLSVDAWKNAGVPAVAFNDASLLTCISNDYGYRHVFEKPIAMFAAKGDLLIAISSSGKSENILRGVDAAREKGCRVVTMSGFDGRNPLRGKGDVNFHVPRGEYGHVEIAHLAIGHAMIDHVIAARLSKAGAP